MIHLRKDYERIQDPENKIPEGEPVFLLRAQDIVAAKTVRHWAYLNEAEDGDPKLTRGAFECAKKMEAWPVHKLADLPEESAEQQGDTEEKPEQSEQKTDEDQQQEDSEQKAKPTESSPGSGVS